MSRDESRNNAMLHAKASGIVRDNVSGSAFIPATQVCKVQQINESTLFFFRDPMGPGAQRKKLKRVMFRRKTLASSSVKQNENIDKERNMLLAPLP